MPPENFADQTKSTSDDPYHGKHPKIVEDFLLEGGRCTPTAKEPAGDCLSRLADPEKYYPKESEQFLTFTPTCEFVPAQSQFTRNSQIHVRDAAVEDMIQRMPPPIRVEDDRLPRCGPYVKPPAQKPYDIKFYGHEL
jgi:hypothetical protein